MAASAGLTLDPWQAFALEVGLSERADGKWSAFEVAAIVSRQNGKGALFEALALAKMFLFGDELFIYSSHEFKTSREAFRRIGALIDATPSLSSRVLRTVRNPSEFGYDLRSGQRLRFFARSGGSGRGWSADSLFLDEAFNLGGAAMAALLPTLSTRPNPQVWYASSAAMATSEQLHAIRARALGDGPGRLAYLEWSAPDDADLDDRDAWAQANPALGYRLTEEFIDAERAALPEPEFRRERLSIPDEPLSRVQAIPVAAWDALADSEGAAVELSRLVLAVDVPPERESSSIVACGLRPDKALQVELVDHRPGTEWVVERLVAVAARRPVAAVVIDGASAAGSLIDAVEAAGLRVIKASSRDMAAACGGLFDAVAASALRQVPHPVMSSALAGARRRKLGDAWAFDRRVSGVDISPLVGAALAHWGATREGARILTAEELMQSFH